MESFQNDLLKEKKTHGECLFPISLYNITDVSTGQILPYHWHEELEFIYLSKGFAVFHIDNEAYELKEGQAVFINGCRLHSAFSSAGKPCSYHAIVFNHEALAGTYDICREYLHDIKINKIRINSIFTGESAWEKELLINLREIISCFSTCEHGYHLAVKGRLLLTFSMILANHAYTINTNKEKASTISNVERLKKVIQYIQDNYQNKIKIDDLATQLNISKHHFCRFFKHVTGKSPIDYINYYRVNRAAALIENSDISIMAAGLESGFDNFSYFIKTFRKYKNCTPSEYRYLIESGSG